MQIIQAQDCIRVVEKVMQNLMKGLKKHEKKQLHYKEKIN